MRTLLLQGIFLSIGLLLAAGMTGGNVNAERMGGNVAPVTLRVRVGYGNVYRGDAWTPIRVTAANHGGRDINGVLQVPQSPSGNSTGGTPAFHGLYQQTVLLPAGVTKTVTLYVPGSGLPSQVTVYLRTGGKTIAAASTYPIGMDASTFLIGAMGGDPESTAWIAPAAQRHVTARVVPLDAATIDTLAPALSSLDAIVLTDTDTSQLDGAQMTALQQFVRAGGSLIVVGGPRWQETLKPLPRFLVPGRLAGSRVLPDLRPLSLFGRLGPSSGPQAAPVSLLTHPTGTVLASERGVPLVVRQTVGNGSVVYLAFDPALNPVLSWPGASDILSQVLADASPLAVDRTWSQQGFLARFAAIFGQRAVIGTLANVPPATVPMLGGMALLTILYLLLVGPVNFLLLRRLRRQHLAWVTIPVLSISFLGTTAGLSTGLRGSQTLVNAISLVTLNGSSPVRPATIYLGVAAPLSGDERLAYNAPALPNPIPQISFGDGDSFFRSTTPYTQTPLGMLLQEGPQTQVILHNLKQWQVRDLSLATTTTIPGSVTSHLTVNAGGTITGTIHNGTSLDLLDPVLVAGQNITFIAPIKAGHSIHTQFRPATGDSADYQTSVWQNLYGQSSLENDFGGYGFGECCQEASLPPEPNLKARVINAASMLGQVQALSSLGEVVLVGWTDRPLGTLSVDGTTPRVRSLTMIAVPLSVGFPAHGPFTLPAGTIAAHLVSTVPRPPQSTSFGRFMRDGQQITVGPGGSFTFEFDLPTTPRVHLHSLQIGIAFGAGGANSGAVYDWSSRRWTPVDLGNGALNLVRPAPDIGPHGQVLIRMDATNSSGDVTINNITDDVQISGQGTVA